MAEEWKHWETQVYFAAAQVDEKPPATQVAIVLNTAGPQALDIHSTFELAQGANTEDRNDVDTVLQNFGNTASCRDHIVFEWYKFWNRSQADGETVDQWVTDLKNKASGCDLAYRKTC